jgi:tetratricopeptide (TPR) repeat protein
MAAGEWSEAARGFDKLIAFDAAGRGSYLGAAMENLLGRGLARLEAGDFLLAVEDFARAEDRWQDWDEPTLLKGIAYYRLGEGKLARKEFLNLHERASRKDAAALAIVAVYWFYGDDQEGFDWAARIEDEVLSERSRALLFGIVGQPEQAFSAAERAFERNREDPVSRLVYFSHLLDRDIEKAEGLALEAIAKAPELPDGHGFLGLVRQRQRDFEAAQKLFEAEIARARGHFRPFLHLGWLKLQMGRPKADVLKWFEKAVRANPRSPECQLALGRFYEYSGYAPELALAAYGKALERLPAWSEAHQYRGLLLKRLGRIDEALEEYSRGSSGSLVHHGGNFMHLGYLLAIKGRFPEAMASFTRSMEMHQAHRGTDTWTHRQLTVLLKRADLEGIEREVERLIGELERHQRDGRGSPRLERTLALARVRASHHKALRPGEYRLAVLPELPPYALIDEVLDAEGPLGAEADRLLLEKFRSETPKKALAARFLYLEGKLFERSGNCTAAAEKYAAVRSLEPGAKEPLLRRVACLRALERSAVAEAELRGAVEAEFRDAQDLWTLWAALSFADLGRSPAELLASLETASDPPSSPRSALRWLFEQLVGGEPLRIDCGRAEEHRGPGGEVWSRDRFHDGGWADDALRFEWKKTADVRLQQSCRFFIPGEPLVPAYRIPLPPGEYAVTLHLGESWYLVAGMRHFDVLIEGEVELEDYHPFAEAGGHAAADPRTFQKRVLDGVLDVEFRHRGHDSPVIMGIEVRRLE